MNETTISSNDLTSLVRDLELSLVPEQTAGLSRLSSHNSEPATTEGVDLYRSCGDGERTMQLAKNAGWALGTGMNAASTTTLCLGWNALNDPPLDDAKVRSTVASIARTHLRNHPPIEVPDGPLFDLKGAGVGRFIGKEVPKRDWVLVDCLPRGIVASIVAPGGTGKSQLALQIAYAVASGQDQYSPWKSGGMGQVLIVCAEDDENEVHRRFDRLLMADTRGGGHPEILANLSSNLFIVPRVGLDNLLTRDDGNEVVPTALVERLALTVASLPNLRLIILDPLSRFRGGEENAAEDTTRFVVAMETLAKATGAAVLGIHHANKASMQGSDSNQSASRGSSALTDGVRLQINLSYPSEKDQSLFGDVPAGALLVARITKTNYSAMGQPIFLRRDDEGRLVGVDVEQRQQTVDDAELKTLVETVRSETARGVDYSKNSFASTFGSTTLFPRGQAAMKQLIDRAVKYGKLQIADGKGKTLRAPDAVVHAKVNLSLH